ncbi:hypothetical protein ACN42_g10832 [Penicillium freii]|uniref:Uncharacterized protein n=1 Tax=Penicillium freii TaxID=48697 RepID=A0A101M9C9_PENFR|nr:hypothetical protein ACN42_g10832 [Penicillium freii]
MRTAISPRFAISKVFNFSIATILISNSGNLQIDISISNSIRPRSTSRQAYRGLQEPGYPRIGLFGLSFALHVFSCKRTQTGVPGL